MLASFTCSIYIIYNYYIDIDVRKFSFCVYVTLKILGLCKGLPFIKYFRFIYDKPSGFLSVMLLCIKGAYAVHRYSEKCPATVTDYIVYIYIYRCGAWVFTVSTYHLVIKVNSN